jgi:hypothetical protein
MAPDRFELPPDGMPAAQLCLSQRVPAGDPARLRAAARRSGAFAAELRRAADVLLSSVESSRWRGPAHRSVVAQLRMHAPQLSAAADRYDGYAMALNGYAGVLDDTAGQLVEIRRRLQDRSAELRQPADLDVELLPLARAFKAGYDQWADGLDRCVRALRQVDEHDPARDLHGFSAFRHQVSHAAAMAVSPFEQAVRHPSLHAISACLGELNTGLSIVGLGLLFICPPAAAACFAAATVLAVAQLAVDSTRRAHGESVSATHLVPGGGLMAHEGIDGAHTLAKHVGKSEEFLRNRLATEPHIRGASTFYDRQTAENAISGLLRANKPQIDRWLAGRRMQLELFGDGGRKLGILLLPASARPTEESGLKVVLRRTPALGIGFYVHTAMVTI